MVGKSPVKANDEQKAALEFWYDFASTYSYLSAMRIEEAGRAAGVDIVWRPFLLGPIFKAQGLTTSPFNLYPAKGRYMARDMERLTMARGLPFKLPSPFPQNSLLAARIALIGCEEGFVAAFSRAVFLAEFGDGADISNREFATRMLDRLGLDSARIMDETASPALKDRFKRQTELAATKGIFGAPSFVCPDGELYWGDDRFNEAITQLAKR